MKTLSSLLRFGILASLVAVTACSKDDDNDQNNGSTTPAGLEGRLIGTWNMTALSYYAEILNPLDPFNPLIIDDASPDVQGTFIVTHDPNSVDYNYSFTAANPFDPSSGLPFNQAGTASWDVIANDTQVVLTEDGETTIYQVVENQPNLQRWTGTLTFDQGPIPIDIDIEFTLERAL